MPTIDVLDSSPSNELAVFAPEGAAGPGVRFALGRPSRRYDSYLRFKRAHCDPAAFLIRSGDAGFNGRLLRLIRQDLAHAANLVFVQGPVPPQDRMLSDGPAPENGAALNQRLSLVQQRRRSLRLLDRSPEALLLCYLWLRPGFILRPQIEPRTGRRRYPLLYAFGIGEAEAESLLGRLERIGLLAPVSGLGLASGAGRLYPAWRLSAMGQLAVQVSSSTLSALSHARHVPFAPHAVFMGRLNWLWRVARARRSFSIGLLWLRPQNAPGTARYGADGLLPRLDAQARGLRQFLAPSDLLTRLDDDTLLVLLPNGDRERLARLQEELRQLNERSMEPAARLEWHHAGVVINSRNAGEDEVASLIRSLQNALAPEAESAQVA